MDPEPILDDEDGGDEEENAAKDFHNHVTDESILKKVNNDSSIFK